MQLTTYHPNFNDPRVQQKVKTALEWCDDTLRADKLYAREVYGKTLLKVFGNVNNQLANWLRANLLLRTGYYDKETGKCFSYYVNTTGYDKVRALLTAAGAEIEAQVVRRKRQFASELASGNFSYTQTEKCVRRIHPLQLLPRAEKAKFWSDAGYRFDYDISTAGPVILYQVAIKKGAPAIVLDTIKDYIDNKRAWRQHVVEITGVSLRQAKTVLTALFNGARLVANHSASIFKALNCDRAAIEALRTDAKICALRRGIKRMWVFLARATGKDVKSKDRWATFFQIERQIIDVALEVVKKTGSKVFIEHDGFRCDIKQDVEEMEQLIYQKTGFVITLDEEDLHEKQEETTTTNYQTGILAMSYTSVSATDCALESEDTASIRHLLAARRAGFLTTPR